MNDASTKNVCGPFEPTTPPVQHVCPACGYCPCCGRGTAAGPYWPYAGPIWFSPYKVTSTTLAISNNAGRTM